MELIKIKIKNTKIMKMIPLLTKNKSIMINTLDVLIVLD